MDVVTGLPYHGYDLETKIKKGIVGWGRAVGWLLLGVVDSMEYFPEGEEKQFLVKELKKLISSCRKYLREDGSFAWQLTAVEGPKDTSSIAMVGYGIKKAVSLGLVTNPEQEQIKKALLDSYRQGKIYDCSAECEGFSQYPQFYGAYPWSLGPALRLLLF